MNQKFEGVVLFLKPYKDKDALVKIFTKEFGTKMFFIKGYYSSSHHKLSKYLIPLTKNQYVGKINVSGLSFITEADALLTNMRLNNDYYKQAYTMYISQLFDASLEDNRQSLNRYKLFTEILDKISQDSPVEILTIYTEIHLLPYFGVHLNWKDCQICHQSQHPMDMSIVKGGFICHQHYFEDPYRLQIDPKAIHVARILANIQLNQVGNIDISQNTFNELRRLMDAIYEEYVGIHLKAKSFIKKLNDFERKLSE